MKEVWSSPLDRKIHQNLYWVHCQICFTYKIYFFMNNFISLSLMDPTFWRIKQKHIWLTMSIYCPFPESRPPGWEQMTLSEFHFFLQISIHTKVCFPSFLLPWCVIWPVHLPLWFSVHTFLISSWDVWLLVLLDMKYWTIPDPFDKMVSLFGLGRWTLACSLFNEISGLILMFFFILIYSKISPFIFVILFF